MIRNIMTLMVAIAVVRAIILTLQGGLTVGIGVMVGLLLASVIFIWLPLKVLYKWSFAKNSDRALFKYAFCRGLVKAIVGQKEYAEMEGIFRDGE